MCDLNVYMQCLEVIKKALEDSQVRAPRRLSMTRRARKICETMAKKSITTKKGGKSKKTEECMKFNMADFPEMKLTPAPEVL